MYDFSAYTKLEDADLEEHIERRPKDYKPVQGPYLPSDFLARHTVTQRGGTKRLKERLAKDPSKKKFAPGRGKIIPFGIATPGDELGYGENLDYELDVHDVVRKRSMNEEIGDETQRILVEDALPELNKKSEYLNAHADEYVEHSFKSVSQTIQNDSGIPVEAWWEFGDKNLAALPSDGGGMELPLDFMRPDERTPQTKGGGKQTVYLYPGKSHTREFPVDRAGRAHRICIKFMGGGTMYETQCKQYRLPQVDDSGTQTIARKGDGKATIRVSEILGNLLKGGIGLGEQAEREWSKKPLDNVEQASFNSLMHSFPRRKDKKPIDRKRRSEETIFSDDSAQVFSDGDLPELGATPTPLSDPFPEMGPKDATLEQFLARQGRKLDESGRIVQDVKPEDVLTPGAKVTLHSLKAHELNGLQGELVEFIAGTGRWRCKVTKGNEISMKDLKPENLAKESQDPRQQEEFEVPLEIPEALKGRQKLYHGGIKIPMLSSAVSDNRVDVVQYFTLSLLAMASLMSVSVCLQNFQSFQKAVHRLQNPLMHT